MKYKIFPIFKEYYSNIWSSRMFSSVLTVSISSWMSRPSLWPRKWRLIWTSYKSCGCSTKNSAWGWKRSKRRTGSSSGLSYRPFLWMKVSGCICNVTFSVTQIFCNTVYEFLSWFPKFLHDFQIFLNFFFSQIVFFSNFFYLNFFFLSFFFSKVFFSKIFHDFQIFCNTVYEFLSWLL